MPESKKNIVILLFVLLLFFLLSYPLNGWLSATMLRHQVIQLPAMFGLGLVMGIDSRHLNIRDISWGIAVLIFIMASFIFWMLPHSIDLAVLDNNFNRTMHFNMFFNGILLMTVLRNTLFEIKILFLGMLSAMLVVAGFTLRTFDILLCSSFNIAQQKQTGLWWIIIGFLLFVFTFIIFFKEMSNPTQAKNENDT